MDEQTKDDYPDHPNSGYELTQHKAVYDNTNYIFRLAEKEEVEEIFDLYVKRVCWMEEKGIDGWNTTHYLERYSLDYFREQCLRNTLYILRNTDDNLLAGAVVLLSKDERWQDKANETAYYIHNLVSSLAHKGAGAHIISGIEKTAIQYGKRFVRLDCAVNNTFLNEYYASKGYKESGWCEEGFYSGIRREKSLPPSVAKKETNIFS